MTPLDPDLERRAHALGIATSYQDWAGRTVPVDPDVVETIVGMLGEVPEPAHPDLSTGDAATLPMPPRCWGWTVQVYALWSETSWGIGDFADLRAFAEWSARELGADLVLVNPLHAVAPAHPIVASPYSPTSRQFTNPLYLHIEDLPEYLSSPPEVRARVDALRLPPPKATDLLDRDVVWDAKVAALQELLPHARTFEITDDLRDFATFCALAEEHGVPWQSWPEDLQDPHGPSAAAAREKLADRIAFHAWLQVLCDEQLQAVQQSAKNAGMRIGVVHDLAVGVDPGGADAWALRESLAGGVSVGAPPDSYNQLGQNWALPPWRPDALARLDYAPYQAMLDAILRHGGGLRVDHVMGLSRLWWIPVGNSADRGTYVSYDAEAMLDVLVAAALDRQAIVVGEDLGTVEPTMRDALSARRVLGSAVLWFERFGEAGGRPLKPPSDWRELAMASISTHDLPTAHGFLVGEHVRVRHELGQLGRPVDEEQAQADADKETLLASLVSAGVLDAGALDNPDAVTLAMHRFMARTPSRILLASPYDVLGEIRQPNLPGTIDQYPNWCIPLPMSLTEMMGDPRVGATAEALRREEGSSEPGW